MDIANIIPFDEDLNDLSFSPNIKEIELISQEYIHDSIKNKYHTRNDFTEEESLDKENLSKNQYSNFNMIFINFLDLISNDLSKVNEDDNIIKEIEAKPETRNKENNFNKFEIKIINERGRKAASNKLLGKKHKKTDNDNIQTKIQVHFINFLINMVNDAVKTEFDPKFLSNLMKNSDNDNVNSKKKSAANFFRYINHKEKKKISYDYIINILQSPIKNIITTNVSSKYRKFKNDYNKMLYLKLKEKSGWFSAFLDQKFIDVFINYYYNEEKQLQMINFEGKTINLSKKTETFAHLLIKNKNLKNQMINIVKNIYLNNYNKSKKFITSKNAL